MLLCLGALSFSLASLGVEFPLIPFSVGSDGPAGPEHLTSGSPFGEKEEHLCLGQQSSGLQAQMGQGECATSHGDCRAREEAEMETK